MRWLASLFARCLPTSLALALVLFSALGLIVLQVDAVGSTTRPTPTCYPVNGNTGNCAGTCVNNGLICCTVIVISNNVPLIYCYCLSRC